MDILDAAKSLLEGHKKEATLITGSEVTAVQERSI
jgi:hypothetical protein